jgi:hypothetical protein
VTAKIRQFPSWRHIDLSKRSRPEEVRNEAWQESIGRGDGRAVGRVPHDSSFAVAQSAIAGTVTDTTGSVLPGVISQRSIGSFWRRKKRKRKRKSTESRRVEVALLPTAMCSQALKPGGF